MSAHPSYDQDYYLWFAGQAQLLRSGETGLVESALEPLLTAADDRITLFRRQTIPMRLIQLARHRGS